MDERENQEEEGRPRPRVVDKRVSARPADAPPPPPEPPPAPKSSQREAEAAPPPQSASVEPEAPAGPSPAGAGPGEEPLWTPEQEAEAQRMVEEIASTPSRDWVLNAAVTMANVAATKIDRGVPEDARLVIDALAAIVERLGPELGEAEPHLRQTLAQLQMAYTQVVQPPPAPPA